MDKEADNDKDTIIASSNSDYDNSVRDINDIKNSHKNSIILNKKQKSIQIMEKKDKNHHQIHQKKITEYQMKNIQNKIRKLESMKKFQINVI